MVSTPRIIPFPASSAAAVVAEENPERVGLLIANGSNATMKIAFGREATSMIFSLVVPPATNEVISTEDVPYWGQVWAVWAVTPTIGAGAVTELTRVE